MNKSDRDFLISLFLLTVFMISLFIVFILAFRELAYGGSLIIPRDRHYFYSPSWKDKLLNRQPAHFAVTARVNNSKSRPQRVKVNCEVIYITEDGGVIFTGEFIPTVPEEAIIYPGKTKNFKVLFPVKKKGSILAAFTCTPVVEGSKGKVLVIWESSYALAVSYGKYKLKEPGFTVKKDKERLFITITNPNLWIIDGVLELDGEESFRTHFFIQAEKRRIFEIQGNYRSALLNVNRWPVILGYRLAR